MSTSVREPAREQARPPVVIRHAGGAPAPSPSPPAGRPAGRPAEGTAEAGEVSVSIEVDRCVGCLACATVCNGDVLRLMPGAWAVEADAERCTACRRCVGACPFGAVTVTGTPRNRRRIIVDRLHASLRSTCPAGWVVATGAPSFRSAPGVPPTVPDLAVVRGTGPGLAWLAVDDVAVPLVVDVLSPAARRDELEPRRELYWQCGVPAYWTVDSRSGEVTVQWSVRGAWFDRWAGFTFA